MKKLLFTISVMAVSLMATDYSQMTMDELNALRGTVPTQEREAFRAEMQNRVQQMTPEEQANFRQERMANKGAGPQDGSKAGSLYKGSRNQTQGVQQRLKDTSGAGSMSQGANSAMKGDGKGKGNPNAKR